MRERAEPERVPPETRENVTRQETIPEEPEFYCANETNRRSRIRCVMGLPDEKVQAVRYVPEECNVANETNKLRCVALYRVLQSCRGEEMEADADRVRCIRPKINVSDEIRQDVRNCQQLTGGENRSACFSRLRENVFTLTKFRIYNLVYKAEELKEKGANEEDVVAFIEYLEDSKKRFNDAGTIRAKIEIVREVKEKWNEFRQKARAQINSSGRGGSS